MTAHFNAVGIVVADMARTLSFYRRLGLEFEAAADAEGHVEWEAPGGVRVMFDSLAVVRSFDPEWQAPVGGPAMTLAFECADAAGVDAAVAQVAAAGFGVHREPWDAFWGQRYATVLDPDGNRVDLFAWA